MSPSPEKMMEDGRPARLAARQSPNSSLEFSAGFSIEERRLLVHLAHEAIASAMEHREISLTPPSSHLAEPRGAFTTLYLRGQLHGCVGYIFPTTSLYRTIAETARAAAFDDPRFPPLTREELPDLGVSLSILSPLSTISPEQVEIGRHGLLISQGPRRGLLLPQVPIEHSWDRITFLEQTCRKAGLAPDAWRAGAKVEGFTAEVFGDKPSAS
jgi:AmmeMemoRadiSam system protein A